MLDHLSESVNHVLNVITLSNIQLDHAQLGIAFRRSSLLDGKRML